ncbi:hypothetical protein TIFTF001_008002 [Ficus carica]|uniref:Uncharacterized protein n=1 Tax=Ficus carica TaxID=3494 RepID=A0AA88CXL5_FICCA|nr:hypothetical protein TIFTF001_008002 [Ficus carica]
MALLMTRSSPTTAHPSRLGSSSCREQSGTHFVETVTYGIVPVWPLLRVLGNGRLGLNRLRSLGRASGDRP